MSTSIMMMRNQQFFDGLHNGIFGKRKIEHEYVDFTVNTHSFMYHGTSMKNYKAIMEQGEICITDYSILQNPVDFDPNNFDEVRAGTGMVYVTDNIDVAAKYALKEHSGVVLCLDLYGYELKRDAKDNSGSREFMSAGSIQMDCLKKVYGICVEKNQIALREMEIER